MGKNKGVSTDRFPTVTEKDAVRMVRAEGRALYVGVVANEDDKPVYCVFAKGDGDELFAVRANRGFEARAFRTQKALESWYFALFPDDTSMRTLESERIKSIVVPLSGRVKYEEIALSE